MTSIENRTPAATEERRETIAEVLPAPDGPETNRRRDEAARPAGPPNAFGPSVNRRVRVRTTDRTNGQ